MEIIDIIAMFTHKKVANHTTKNTSHGENDFRLAILVKFEAEFENTFSLPYDLVIKLADNDFTTPERLKVMQRTAQEYGNLGYYCPQFFTALNGTFPYIDYQGHHCIAYAEEYSVYKSAEQFDETFITGDNGYYTFFDDAWIMNARIAAQHFDYTDLPSAYCLFDTFSPSDTADEVMENAMTWYEIAQKLPPQFSEQVERIWNRFLQNRNELAQYYNRLPSSVFQADTNYTNILLTEQGQFAGVYDFNICGKDVFLNYLMREVPYVCHGDNASLDSKDPVLDSVLHALATVKNIYHFNELEKAAALPLWRCLKPLWWSSIQQLKKALGDNEKIQAALNKVEELQTRPIDFESIMS